MNTARIHAGPAAPGWREFSRAAVLGAIEDATGRALSASDPLPDTLIAAAGALGLVPGELKLFIYDGPRDEWSIQALAVWARAYGVERGA